MYINKHNLITYSWSGISFISKYHQSTVFSCVFSVINTTRVRKIWEVHFFGPPVTNDLRIHYVNERQFNAYITTSLVETLETWTVQPGLVFSRMFHYWTTITLHWYEDMIIGLPSAALLLFSRGTCVCGAYSMCWKHNDRVSTTTTVVASQQHVAVCQTLRWPCKSTVRLATCRSLPERRPRVLYGRLVFAVTWSTLTDHFVATDIYAYIHTHGGPKKLHTHHFSLWCCL